MALARSSRLFLTQGERMMRDESSLIKKSRYRTWLLGGDTVFCERAIKGQKSQVRQTQSIQFALSRPLCRFEKGQGFFICSASRSSARAPESKS
jgi:hypothetical protein